MGEEIKVGGGGKQLISHTNTPARDGTNEAEIPSSDSNKSLLFQQNMDIQSRKHRKIIKSPYPRSSCRE